MNSLLSCAGVTPELFMSSAKQRRVKPVTVNGTIGLSKSYPVEVRSAGHKGLGVFATKNIKRGEVCCYYDGLLTSGLNKGALITGENGYNQDFNDYVIAGFREQHSAGGCAQMCNDASTSYTNDEDLTYLKNINVAEKGIDGEGLAFVATKRIKKGEELLYSYGPEYWQIHNAREKEEFNDKYAPKALWDSCLNNLNDEIEPKVMDIFRGYNSSGTDLTNYYDRLVLTELLCKFQNKFDKND